MFRQIHFRVFWIGCFLSMFLLLSAQSKLDSLHHLHEVVITAKINKEVIPVQSLSGDKGSVVILGGLSLVNSLHAYTFASLKRKKLISTTPLNDALNALILALNASAAAFVLLFTKKFRILS